MGDDTNIWAFTKDKVYQATLNSGEAKNQVYNTVVANFGNLVFQNATWGPKKPDSSAFFNASDFTAIVVPIALGVKKT